MIFRYYFNKKSVAQHGTLYQLRNLLGRTNVVKVPLDDFNACDDFFVLVVKSHIVAAAMQMLGISDVGEIPSSPLYPDLANDWMETAEHRKEVLDQISKDLVDKYVNFSFNSSDDVKSSEDGVFEYAKGLLSLGCFYLEYSDAIREGDGDRDTRCWRYLLPMFYSSGRKNYALESLNLLFQHDYSLSPRQAAELSWSRFVNVHGLPGKNIPNDLHMEHLNRVIKTSLKGLGANKTEKAITTVGEVLGVVGPILDTFDAENNVSHVAGTHRVANINKDMTILLKELKTVFSKTPGRQHMSFKKTRDPLHHKTVDEIKEYIMKRIKLQ